jgi:hypothetical protein
MNAMLPKLGAAAFNATASPLRPISETSRSRDAR